MTGDVSGVLVALAGRCEGATGADRELDAEIQIRLFEKPDYRFPDKVLNRRPDSWREAAGRFRHDGFGGEMPWPAFTASLDAAMSLVPEGMILRRYMATKHVPHGCEVGLDWAHGGWIGESDHSFALALTAASLRARAAMEPSNG